MAAASRPPVDGSPIMNTKIHVLVRIDPDGARARLLVRGEVTAGSVQALYVLARRANSLVPALALVLDVSGAQVSPNALEELHARAVAAHLPVRIDPPQSVCRLIIPAPSATARTGSVMGLAA